MSSSPILFEELPGNKGKLGLITLNRPKSLNALTHEMIIQMHQKLLEWEDNNNIKAVVVCAAEGRAFCAGGDLRLVYERHANKDTTLLHFFRDEYRLNHYIFHYPKPYISFMDGITMGGGAGISINGSHRVGTERTLFAMPETGIGFFPDVGGSYFLSRLPYGLGFYIGLTGVHLSSDDCLEMQLISYKIQSSTIPEIIKTLTQTLLQDNAHEKVRHVLHMFNQVALLSPLTAHYSFINQNFIKHSIEEILLALETKASPWCLETAAILKKKSPTSLKVALKQLHEGSKRDFDQCMQLEYHLTSHFIQAHDFYEGIRTVLIEKNQSPKWQPAQLSEISQEYVESYFRPLSGESAQLLFT